MTKKKTREHCGCLHSSVVGLSVLRYYNIAVIVIALCGHVFLKGGGGNVTFVRVSNLSLFSG